MSEIIGLSLTSACPPHVSKRKLRNRRMQAVRNLNPGLQETPAPNSLACFPLTMTIWDQYLGSSEAHSWCLNPADMKLGRPVVTVPCQRYYRRLSMIIVIIMMATSWADIVYFWKSSASWPPHVSKYRMESSCLLLGTLQSCLQSYNSPLRVSHLPQHRPL